MSSTIWLLAVGSRDLSKDEKETTACKAEQIHKMGQLFSLKMKTQDHFVNLLSLASNYLFLSLR